MKLFFKFAILLAMATLIACGHVPVSSMVQLQKLDILETNIGALYTAVRLPDAIAPQDDGIVLQMGYNSKDKKQVINERFVMQPVGGIPSAALQKARKTGYRISIFRIAKRDVKRMTTMRARIKALRNGKNAGQGSLAIQAATCRRHEIPEGPLYLTTFIKSEELKDFVILTLNVDLRRLEEVGSAINQIPPCQ